MSFAGKFFGILFIIGAFYLAYDTFKEQIIGEVAQQATPSIFDFFIEQATPEITVTHYIFGGISFLMFIIGIVLLSK